MLILRHHLIKSVIVSMCLGDLTSANILATIA